MAFQYRDKLLFLFSVAVIVLSTLSYYSSLASDPTRCEVLLNNGFWLNPDHLINWQPSGCRLYWYENREPAMCLQDRRVVMVGGQSTRALFENVVKKFNPEYALPDFQGVGDVQALHRKVNFEFVWDPNLEGTKVNELRAGFDDDITRPALTVFGFERDQVQLGPAAATQWSTHVDNLFSGFRGDTPERARQSDAVVFTPLLEPNVPRLASSPIDDLNNVVRSMASKYQVDVAFAFNDVIKPKSALMEAKYATPQALNVMSEILLNFRCNAGQPNAYPYAGTCCNSYPKANWIQVILVGTIVIFLIIAPIAAYLKMRGTTVDSSWFLRYTPASEYHGSILALGVAGVLCWYLDRTNVFGKEQKDWSPFLLGLVSIPTAISLYILGTTEKDPTVVEKRQSDDWKGIMQVIILMYRYCDYASTDYIYNTYLFVLGAETTIYFLRDQDDYSLKRIVTNLLRYNLFRAVVAYSTGSNWTLNFFPLVLTWNYLITLAVFIPYRQKNGNILWLLGKFAAVIGATLLLYKIPKIIEIVWAIISFFFHIHSDGSELRFRFTEDQYSCFFGIACGMVYHQVASRVTSLPQTQLVSTIKKVWLVVMLVLNNSYTAWVGRGWLETYLLQFHTWLAADSAGLLMIGLIPASQRLLNVLLTTPLYFYISWLATHAIQAVIEWIMVGTHGGAAGSSDQAYKGIPMGDAAADDEEDEEHGEGHFAAVNGTNGSAGHGATDIEAAPVKEQRPEGGVGSVQSKLANLRYGDWRVRVGAGLVLAAVMNWTWDL